MISLFGYITQHTRSHIMGHDLVHYKRRYITDESKVATLTNLYKFATDTTLSYSDLRILIVAEFGKYLHKDDIGFYDEVEIGWISLKRFSLSYEDLYCMLDYPVTINNLINIKNYLVCDEYDKQVFIEDFITQFDNTSTVDIR